MSETAFPLLILATPLLDMVKLSTQPPGGPAPVQLRSGFWALPFDGGKNWIYAREHHRNEEGTAENDQDVAVDSSGRPSRLFVTGLPLSLTTAEDDGKAIKSLFSKVVYGANSSIKCTDVELLPASSRSAGATLLARELASAAAAAEAASTSAAAAQKDIPALFPSSLSTWPPAVSALLTFSARPTLPPPAYASLTPVPNPPAAVSASSSALLRSKALYALARPHRSSVIAHSDAWMRAFDARQHASRLATGYVAQPGSTGGGQSATERKKARKQLRQVNNSSSSSRNGKAGSGSLVGPDGAPMKGSAAAALAAFAAAEDQRADPNYNPDDPELDEQGWTLVSRGGRHGKSLLPADATPTVQGYGGRNVKVARTERAAAVGGAGGSSSDDDDDDAEKDKEKHQQGIRKIVGSGFYRHTKDMERRQGE